MIDTSIDYVFLHKIFVLLHNKQRMKKDEQSEPVSVLYNVLEPQSSNLMKHNFYELIFFCSGRGKHFNHQVSNEFLAGDLFLTKPYEEHAFIVEEQTEVYIVRFKESARLVLKELVDSSNGRAVALAKAKSPLNPKVTFNEQDKGLVLRILELLKQLDDSPAKNENLCYYQLLCLVAVIERNLQYSQENTSKQATRKDISLILNHIHKYLQKPELLTLLYIASKFNMSSNLLGIYFKQETGQSVKQYINKCRLEVIGEKVVKSKLSFSEIAFQFGYVDESHFHKSFKKFYGIAPGSYRAK